MPLLAFTTGSRYRRARLRDLPAAAWVLSATFSVSYSPRGWRGWAVLRWPATLLEVALFRYAGELFVAPPNGRLTAVQAVTPPTGRTWRVGVAALAVVVLVPVGVLLAAEVASPALAVTVAGWLLWIVAASVLVFVPSLLVRIGLQLWQLRTVGRPGLRPVLAGPVVELSSLAAWPPGSGGFRLFDDVLAGLLEQLPAGTQLLLEPATAALDGMYAHRQFRPVEGTHWMVRVVP